MDLLGKDGEYERTVQIKTFLTLPSIADIYAPIYNCYQLLTTNTYDDKISNANFVYMKISSEPVAYRSAAQAEGTYAKGACLFGLSSRTTFGMFWDDFLLHEDYWLLQNIVF
jgi:hypothetical protein